MSHEPHRTASPERAAPEQVFFDRHELNQILRIYGRMVAAGEWRDYAVAGGPEAAVFAIYRRTAEAPVYRIEKRPSLARRQGAFAVIGEGASCSGADTALSWPSKLLRVENSASLRTGRGLRKHPPQAYADIGTGGLHACVEVGRGRWT